MPNTKPLPFYRHSARDPRPYGAWKRIAANMKIGDFKRVEHESDANAIALALTRLKCRVSVLKYDEFYCVIRLNRL